MLNYLGSIERMIDEYQEDFSESYGCNCKFKLKKNSAEWETIYICGGCLQMNKISKCYKELDELGRYLNKVNKNDKIKKDFEVWLGKQE